MLFNLFCLVHHSSLPIYLSEFLICLEAKPKTLMSNSCADKLVATTYLFSTCDQIIRQCRPYVCVALYSFNGRTDTSVDRPKLETMQD